MPSISQAKLNELNDEVEDAVRRCNVEVRRSEAAQARVKTFDAILDKITRAARGLPLIEDRNRHGFGYTPGYVEDGHRCQPPPVEEVLRQQVNTLHERIVSLESHLAAVIAVAEFAKEHKS